MGELNTSSPPPSFPTGLNQKKTFFPWLHILPLQLGQNPLDCRGGNRLEWEGGGVRRGAPTLFNPLKNNPAVESESQKHSHRALFPISHTQKAELVYHRWRLTGERQAAGTLWVAVVSLVDQALDVGGQSGCRGADGVVPQDVDHVVQSVQSVLHLGLGGTPGQRSGCGFGGKGRAACVCLFSPLFTAGCIVGPSTS